GVTVKPFNPRLVTVTTRNAPIQAVNSIYIQVLQWFIQIQTTPLASSYLQILPDWGVIKIVPLLSTAGSGTGSPIPAAILDKVPLGNLWVNYTFGFGQPITGYTLTNVSPSGSFTIYQVDNFDYRLWAPSQTTTVYIDSVAQAASSYTVDYPNGIVTFNADIGSGHTVTADFMTNNTVPYDIKEVVILKTIRTILSGLQNPMRLKNISLNNYSTTYDEGEDEDLKEVLKPYRRNSITIL
ncbi:MAG: hypothetical protein ACYDBV_14205, partial [Nitrospiria bacterium]